MMLFYTECLKIDEAGYQSEIYSNQNCLAL